jgi:hypothetical protein
MTTSLSSSLDMLSLASSTRWASDSASDEDEIVWSLSSSGVLSSSSPLNSPLSETADYVLVPRVDNTNASTTATTTTTVATTAAAITAAPATGQAAPLLPPQQALTPDGIADEMATLSLSSAYVPASASVSARPPANKKSRKKGAGPLSAATAEPGVPMPPNPAPASASASAAAPRGTSKRKKARAHSASSSASSSSSPGGSVSAAGHVIAQSPPPALLASSSSPPKSNAAARKHDGHRSSSSRSSSAAVSAPTKPKARRAKKGAVVAAAAAAAALGRERSTGLGLRTVVDDSLSEASGEERSSTVADATTVGYHEAQKYMTS